MKVINVLLVGYGHVGKSFFELIQDKRIDCQRRYDLELHILAVFRQKGAWYSKDGFRGEHPDDRFWYTDMTIEEVLSKTSPGVMVECAVSSSETGQPGIEFMLKAMDRGWNVVTADKGPLVVGMKALQQSAIKNHVALKISGATAAALPTLDVALNSLAGAEISEIEAILNGTSNFVLTRMHEGSDYAEALKEAQSKGIAEPDPAIDVEGWDAAYKLLLISQCVLNQELVLNDVEVTGISHIQTSDIDSGVSQGKKLKLMAKMRKKGKDLKLEVAPMWLDSTHPLVHVDGTNKGISFKTDTMGTVTVTGGKSDPRGAAAALLKDIIQIYWNA